MFRVLIDQVFDDTRLAELATLQLFGSDVRIIQLEVGDLEFRYRVVQNGSMFTISFFSNKHVVIAGEIAPNSSRIGLAVGGSSNGQEISKNELILIHGNQPEFDWEIDAGGWMSGFVVRDDAADLWGKKHTGLIHRDFSDGERIFVPEAGIRRLTNGLQNVSWNTVPNVDSFSYTMRLLSHELECSSTSQNF